jgi:hypothetical protein
MIYPNEARFKCKLCNKYYDTQKFNPTWRTDLADDQGSSIDPDYKKKYNKIYSHFNLASHKAVVNMLIEKKASELTTVNIDAQHRLDEHQEIYVATANMLRTIF